MTKNYYKDIFNQLLEIKPTLLSALQEREMEVRSKEKNIYQVYWKNRVENEFAEVQTELVSILEDYHFFQDSMGKEVNEYLSLSKEKGVKSLLNIFRMDVWFEKDVSSRFKQVNGKYFRYFKDHLQPEIFFENRENEEEAKQAMIEQCRIEIIDSFHTKCNYIENYLDKEIKKLYLKLSEITKSEDKPSSFFKYGFQVLEKNSTIAIIILGVSVECSLKQKYRSFIRESISLGQIIYELERRKRMTKTLDLLKDLNNSYVKAKHEKDYLVSKEEVELYYQKATAFF